MRAPYEADVRLLEVAAKGLEDFRAYLQKYAGHKGRFLDPVIADSADVRLSARGATGVQRRSRVWPGLGHRRPARAPALPASAVRCGLPRRRLPQPAPSPFPVPQNT